MAVGKDVQSRHTTKYRRNRRTIHNQYADDRLTLELGMFLSISTVVDGHWLLFVSNLVTSVLTFLLVPLIATFVQVSPSENGWKAVISDKKGYTLISIYGLLALLTAVILARLSGRDSGLKWDPVSIADQLALIQGSNIWNIFSGLEFSSQKDFPASLKERTTNFGTIRLGCWKHRQEDACWHGIAFLPVTDRHYLIIYLLEDMNREQDLTDASATMDRNVESQVQFEDKLKSHSTITSRRRHRVVYKLVMAQVGDWSITYQAKGTMWQFPGIHSCAGIRSRNAIESRGRLHQRCRNVSLPICPLDSL